MAIASPRDGKSKVVDLPGDLGVARLEISRDSDYHAAIDIHHDGRHYQFGVHSNGELELIQAFEEHERLHDVEAPEWVAGALETVDFPGRVA